MNFPSQIFFNDIGYKAALLKKNSCGCFQFIWMWLLIAVMKRGALLKCFYSFSVEELNNIESEDEVFAQEFSCEESDF